MRKQYLMPLSTRKVKITDVIVAYWLEPIDEGQEYIVPVFEFGGQCFDAFGKQLKGNFRGYVKAVN